MILANRRNVATQDKNAKKALSSAASEQKTNTSTDSLEQIWFISPAIVNQYYKQMYLQEHQWKYKHLFKKL